MEQTKNEPKNEKKAAPDNGKPKKERKPLTEVQRLKRQKMIVLPAMVMVPLAEPYLGLDSLKLAVAPFLLPMTAAVLSSTCWAVCAIVPRLNINNMQFAVRDFKIKSICCADICNHFEH